MVEIPLIFFLGVRLQGLSIPCLFIGLWHALSLGPEYLDLGLEGRLSFLHYSSSGQLVFFEG